ncbi:MAG: lipopolysaccharide biosynthesis protein [Chloroflexi bacterium]|nr:lipopolysaccharide biosynthesis protein [Chloroflexota bacterium]
MITESGTNSSQHIAGKAFRGVIWNFLAYGLGKGIVLITTSILARLLSKGDFGLVAIAVVAINYLAVVKDLGLGVALIQRREDVNDAANTVFTMNLILGLSLSAIIVPLAPVLAVYFKDPLVTPVLRWLGLSFAINALGAVHVVWLMRELDYKRKLIPDMGNAIMKGVVSIGMAYAGFGVWSLVAGQLLGALVSVVLVWIILPWRPQLALHRNLIGELMKFGASITGIDIITVITDNLDYVIVGRVFGLAQLSVYTLAYRLPEMLLIGNLWVMGGVIFPTFSSIQDKPDEMRRGFLASVRIIELLAVPVCLGLLIAADPIVRVLFGEQWLEAIPVLMVLAVYAWVYSIGYHIGSVYKAIGRPDILFKLSIITLLVIVPSLLIGSRFGLIGIAYGLLFAIIIRRIISLFMATQFIRVSLWDIFSELRPALRGALVMTPVTLAVLYLTVNVNPFLRLALIVLTGAVSYLGILWWFEKDNLLRLARLAGDQEKVL